MQILIIVDPPPSKHCLYIHLYLLIGSRVVKTTFNCMPEIANAQFTDANQNA